MTDSGKTRKTRKASKNDNRFTVDSLLGATHDNPVFVETNVPAFLQPLKHDHFPLYTEWTFEEILERTCDGETLAAICKDPTMPQNVRTLRKWIFEDEERKQRFYDAQEIGTEAMADKMVAIADGVDAPLEDSHRSKIRLDTYKFLMQSRNRKRFGEKRDIDTTLSINIQDAIKEANGRVIELRPSDVRQLPPQES
jgi:hypothetical protein